jgi:hypothetical protein
MLRRLSMFLAAALLSTVAEAGTCILAPAHREPPKFAEYLYQSADSIALVRVLEVANIASSELGRATVEVLESLKGAPSAEFKFHTLRMPAGPFPKKGETWLIAVNGGVAPACLNIFAAGFERPILVAELRRIRESSKSGAP